MSTPLSDAAAWSDRVRQVFQRYDEELFRRVAARLYRPRNQWPLNELIERTTATLDNVAVIDRRLADLDPASKVLLTVIGRGRLPRWPAGQLLEMLAALGHTGGIQPIVALLERGLLYPDIDIGAHSLKSFEHWLGLAGPSGLPVFAHPNTMDRARRQELHIPDAPVAVAVTDPVHESDGLEWPLRLAAAWQLVSGDSLRRTQSGEFFKRDLDRLRGDPLLNTSAEEPEPPRDPGLLAIALARVEGIVQEKAGTIEAGTFPDRWDEGLFPSLTSLWTSVLRLDTWNAHDGWKSDPASGNPYPSAYLLALLILDSVPPGDWLSSSAVEDWVWQHHPFWGYAVGKATARPASVRTGFLLGLALQLRVVQAARAEDGSWALRLSDFGRWLVGRGAMPTAPLAYPKTLLVQPNLEIVAYRQGLTPALIASLSRLAIWKTLGPACTLQLRADTVYRALQSGQTLADILQLLERHGMRSTPTPVVDSLRTWADKRERINVCANAALFEFASPEDLQTALSRGLAGERLSERLLVVPDESSIDYRHFRLTGTRDYQLPPDRCIEVADDGVTLIVDTLRSDLLLETELRRFVEPLERLLSNERRQYRITPATMRAGRESGLSIRTLEEWFQQRTGKVLPAAARLLAGIPCDEPLQLRRQLILNVGSPEIADGLLQWPATHELIQGRLGPNALVVAEEHVTMLTDRLREIGLEVTSSVSFS